MQYGTEKNWNEDRFPLKELCFQYHMKPTAFVQV